MRRKVEIERFEPIMGHHNRPLTQYEVRGSLLSDNTGAWTSVLLTRQELPFGNGLTSTSRVAKTEAMELANEWFKMIDAKCEHLVFGKNNKLVS